MTVSGGNDRYVDPLTGKPIADPNLPPLPPPYLGGYQDPPGYQGFGGYPEPPRPKRTLLVVSLIGIVLAVAGIITVTLVNSDDRAKPTARATPTRSVAPSPATTSAAPISLAPVIPGWQSVAAANEKVAYDVPQDWKVETPGTLVGFEDASGPRATMHAVATYKVNACPGAPGSYRAHTGFMKLINRDPQSLSAVAAKYWAEAAAELPEGDPSVPQPAAAQTKIANGVPAWTATSTIQPKPSGTCDAPTMKITTVAFSVPAGSALFVVYADQGVPDALPDDLTAKIITSLRGIG